MVMSTPFKFSDPFWRGSQHLIKVDDGKTKWNLAYTFKEVLPNIYNMELREDDVWLLGLPKSGTTWATEVIYSVYHGVEKAANTDHFDRWAFPELSAYDKIGLDTLPKDVAGEYQQEDCFQKCASFPSPRFLRTHIPLDLLPPHLLDTCKVVYICRSLKDCCVSEFGMLGDTAFLDMDSARFSEYVDEYISDEDWFSPRCEHIKNAWKRRHHPNMHFVFYEDMKKDLPSALHNIATFLGTSLKEEDIENLQKHLSVENSRKNKNFNLEWRLKKIGFLGKDQSFVRKGVVGDWKNYFTPEVCEKWDRWWNKHMAATDFKYPE